MTEEEAPDPTVQELARVIKRTNNAEEALQAARLMRKLVRARVGQSLQEEAPDLVRRRVATVTVEVWVNAADLIEVEAETTYLHPTWHESYRATLAEMAQAALQDSIDEEFSE